MDYVYMGQDYKIQAVREIMQRGSFTLDQIAYVGDDVIDLPVMRVCGLAIAVANAREQVKSAAHYVTPNPGGQGAGRDAIDFVLQAQGSSIGASRNTSMSLTPRRTAGQVSMTARWRMLSLWVDDRSDERCSCFHSFHAQERGQTDVHSIRSAFLSPSFSFFYFICMAWQPGVGPDLEEP